MPLKLAADPMPDYCGISFNISAAILSRALSCRFWLINNFVFESLFRGSFKGLDFRTQVLNCLIQLIIYRIIDAKPSQSEWRV